MADRMTDEMAVVSHLPWRDGDGYSWGGEVILTIGARSIMFSSKDGKLVDEIARRWNAGRRALQAGGDE